MIDRSIFETLLAKFAKVQAVAADDILFGGGIDLSSIGFTELRLKFQVQHPRPAGHRMLRWTDDTSTSTARNVA